jgi:hypothetical protein
VFSKNTNAALTSTKTSALAIAATARNPRRIVFMVLLILFVLELEARAELHDAGIVGSRDCAPAVCVHGIVRKLKIHMIRGVECFPPKLQYTAFANMEISGQS